MPTPSSCPGPCPTPRGSCAGRPPTPPTPSGYWPCQAVATYALSGLPAIDTGVTASLGTLHAHGRWNTDLLGCHGRGRVTDAHGRADGPGGRHPAGERHRHHRRHHRRAVRPDRGRGDRARRRARDLRRHAHRVGRVRRVGGGARADQLSAHDARALPHRGTEQRRGALRRLGPPAPPRCAPARPRPRAAGAPARRSRPGPGVAALRPGRAHALRGPHVALEPLRARHRRRGPRRSSAPRTRPAAS